MSCPFCGAVLRGTYCSKCGRRPSDGALGPALADVANPFTVRVRVRLEPRRLRTIAVAAAATLILAAFPALAALAAVAFLARALRDAGVAAND